MGPQIGFSGRQAIFDHLAAGIPRILDVTLRDGSYLIDFQFTAQDTTTLCAELEKAGVGMIELGHGIGLGASRITRYRAAESDEAYMRAASNTLTTSSWGMFCIPGVATLDDLRLAASFGMDFVRIGTNVDSVEHSQPFIELARKLGMFVCANFMKSYAIPPEQFAQKACQSHTYGADLIYLVDSAGGMMPEDVESFIMHVRAVSDVPIGFHGHDNLNLAMANALQAVEKGACLVDTSLRGMGRSAGNTHTESFLAIMERRGVPMGINLIRVLDAAECYVAPLLLGRQSGSVDVVAGMAQFHSSYMGIIRTISRKYRVDPRLLIIELCKINKLEAPQELVESLALEISERAETMPRLLSLERFYGNEQNLT